MVALAIVAFPIFLALLMPSWRSMALVLLINLPLGALFAWPQIADPALRGAGIGIALGAYVWGLLLGTIVYGVKRIFVRQHETELWVWRYPNIAGMRYIALAVLGCTIGFLVGYGIDGRQPASSLGDWLFAMRYYEFSALVWMMCGTVIALAVNYLIQHLRLGGRGH